MPYLLVLMLLTVHMVELYKGDITKMVRPDRPENILKIHHCAAYEMASGKYELWTVDCGLRTADCGLRTADSGHLATDWVYSIIRPSLNVKMIILPTTLDHDCR